MQAVRVHVTDGSDPLLRYGVADDPKLRSTRDVIVKLKAAAVNRIDLTIGTKASCNQTLFPHIPGADGAGTAVSVGAEVRNVKPGDAVCIYPVIGCGQCRFCANDQECEQRSFLGEREDGTYAEYVRVPENNCFAIPAGLSFEEAAAIPLVYGTVWRMLFTHADLKPGESVLIIGAGGVGCAALQMATVIGTRVFVASRSEQKLAAAAGRGAHEVINYQTHDLAKEVRRLTVKRGVDVVVNSVGGDSWGAGIAALSRGGRLVTCGAVAATDAKTDLRRVFWNHLRILGASSARRHEFRRVLNFFANSGHKPLIDRVFPLPDACSAQQRLQQGESFGKIILCMNH